MRVPTICGQGSSVNHTLAGRCVLPRWCGRWGCEECRVVRLKRVIAEIMGGEPTLFLTITWLVRAGWTPEEAARALSRAWAKFAAWHNRKHGERSLQYFVVPEATKKGWPHLHIAIRAPWISLKKLRALLAAEIQSPVVKLIVLDGIHRVAAYLAKYLGKGPHQFGTMKRYWKTLSWLLPAFFEEGRRRRQAGERNTQKGNGNQARHRASPPWTRFSPEGSVNWRRRQSDGRRQRDGEVTPWE